MLDLWNFDRQFIKGSFFSFFVLFLRKLMRKFFSVFNPLSAKPTNDQAHSTIRRLLRTNCVSAFDHFVRSTLKGSVHTMNEGTSPPSQYPLDSHNASREKSYSTLSNYRDVARICANTKNGECYSKN